MADARPYLPGTSAGTGGGGGGSGGSVVVTTEFDDETLIEDTTNRTFTAAAWNDFFITRELTADDDQNDLELSLRGIGGNQWESYLIPADLFRLQAFNTGTTDIGVNWQMKSTRGGDQVGTLWNATGGFPHSVVRLTKRTGDKVAHRLATHAAF